ncbi:hypothetical protein Trydic_g23015 [Trypoxylus dichotomus]
MFGILYPMMTGGGRLDPSLKVRIYKTILRPAITYASAVWATASPTHIRKLEAFQSRFGGEAVLHRFSNPHHDWALFKQSQYEVWVPSYTTSDISKNANPRKSLTKKTFIVRTTINFLPTTEETVFRR